MTSLAMQRFNQWRRTRTPGERSEIRAAARRLRAWVDEGSPDDKVGAERKFFGLDEDAFIALAGEGDVSPNPMWPVNWGHAWVGEGWRVGIFHAYSPNYVWVGAQCARGQAWTTLPSPVKYVDITEVITFLSSKTVCESLHWMGSGGPKHFGVPWTLPTKYGRFDAPKVYFGWSPDQQDIHIGLSASPTVRAALLKRKLMGVYGGTMERAQSKLAVSETTFLPSKQLLKVIVRMCRHYARSITQ